MQRKDDLLEVVLGLRVIVTGGGTGGHIYPALAIAQGIERLYQGSRVLYIGTAAGMESRLVPAEGLNFKTVQAKGLVRRVSWAGLKALAITSVGFLQAWRLVRTFKPQLVIGTGGYVCAPVVLAAHFQKIPIVLHEQNAFPGLTNRMLSRVANRVMLNFKEAEHYFPPGTHAVHTGLPVRPEILWAERSEGERELALQPGATHLLVVGGSQGAKSINEAMIDVWKHCCGREDIQILHVTGEKGFQECKEKLQSLFGEQMLVGEGNGAFSVANITLRPYLHHMEYALAGSDLVIGRAGASFLAELTVRGLPAILVPYPHAAENHQEYNARSLSSAGASVMILDRELNGPVLVETIQELLQVPGRLEDMAVKSKALGHSRALEQIMAVIKEMVE